MVEKAKVKMTIKQPIRSCTCHSDDRPAVCQRKYALTECIAAAKAKPRMKINVTLDLSESRIDAIIRVAHAKGFTRKDDRTNRDRLWTADEKREAVRFYFQSEWNG